MPWFKRHGRRIIKIAALFFFVTPWLIYGYVAFELRSALGAIEASGDSHVWTDFIPALPPPGRNAAVIYERAFGELTLTEGEHALVAEAAKTGKPESADWTRLGLILDRNAEPLSLMVRATEQAQCVFKADRSVAMATHHSPAFGKVRQGMRLLLAQAHLSKHRGDLESAIRTTESALLMANHVGAEEPTLLPFLVRLSLMSTAINGLEMLVTDRELSRRNYDDILKKLNSMMIKHGFTGALRSERAALRQTFEFLRAGRAKELDPNEEIGLTPGTNIFARFLLAHDEAFALRSLTSLCEVSRRESFDWRFIEGSKKWELAAKRRGCTLSSILLPLYPKVFSKAAVTEARVDLARIAMALRLYRIDYGTYPTSLAELAPKYLARVPPDPFSHKPFIFKREGAGFMVYSVGPNFRDDNGVNDAKKPENGDLVWRSGDSVRTAARR